MFERKSWLFCNLKMISKINGDLIWTFWTLQLIWGSHYFLARDKIVEKSWINFLCQSWLQRIATRIDKLQERLVKIHECLWDIITPCYYYCLDVKNPVQFHALKSLEEDYRVFHRFCIDILVVGLTCILHPRHSSIKV